MESYEKTRRDPRAPFEGDVRIEFSNLSSFVSECVTNISLGGMFISTTRLAPLGTRFRFELAVSSGLDLVSGEAEVVWTHEQTTSPLDPAGMGVRFIKLDGDSREVIFKIVDTFIQETGRDPFSLE